MATFLRAFTSQLEQSGPRQLTGRVVPYNVVADVADDLGDGKLDIYREGFRPGAFEPQVRLRDKLAKIGLVHTHFEGGLGYLGPFIGLREQPDGLWGDVRIVPSKAADVEALLESGVNELSVEFRLPKSNHTTVDSDGVKWRTRAHLDRVALEPKGAYSTAQVLAFRAELDEEQREQAEAEAAAAAAKQQEVEVEEALAKEHERAEAEAAHTADMKRRWDLMLDRLAAEEQRQQEYVRRFGLTRPGGFQRLS